MLEMIAYTDGSCLNNPGVGGFAAVMLAKGKKKICQGFETGITTNNKMELRAAIEVLRWLNEFQKEPAKVTFFTDSQYLCNCYNHNWSELTSPSRANNELWIQFIEEGIRGQHEIKFVKVKGHDDDEYNREADSLARAQAVKARHIRYGR